MEAIKLDKSLDNQAKVQISPARRSEQKPRFHIVKLEERIAPNNGNHSIGVCGRSHVRGCYR